MKTISSLQGKGLSCYNSKNGSFKFPFTGSIPGKGEKQYSEGKEKFKLFLDSNNSIFLKTAISVTLDYKLHGKTDAKKENFANGSSKTMSSEECTHCFHLCHCNTKTPLSVQRRDCPSSVNAIKEHSRCKQKTVTFNTETVSQVSPPQKRALSPSNMASPSKRKKVYSSQKNKILRYLIPVDVTDIKDRDQNSEVHCTSSRNTTCSENESRLHVTNVEEPHWKTSSEIITISSDEESDSTRLVSSEEIISNLKNSSLDIDCNAKFNISSEEMENYMTTCYHRKSNFPISHTNSYNREQSWQDTHVISSDEDEKCSTSHSQVIDLTCDDSANSVDDGDGVPLELVSLEKGSINDKQQHKTRYSQDATKEENRKRKSTIYDKNYISFHEESDIICSLSHDKTFTERNNIEVSSCDISLQCNSQSSAPISHCKTEHNLEHELRNYCSSENVVEGKRDTILLEETNSTTSSSLPSPPMFGNDDLNDETTMFQSMLRDETNQENNVGDMKSVLSNISEFGKCNKFFSEESTNNYFTTEACSDTSDDIDDDDDKVTALRSASQYKTIEEEFLAPVSEIYQDDISMCHFPPSKTVRPSAVRVCEVHAQIFLSKLYSPWKELGSRYIPKCCLNGPDKCSKLHTRKQNLTGEVKHHDDIFIVRMESLPSAIDFLRHRLESGCYPTSVIVQYIILCAVGWKQKVAEVLFCLKKLLDEHPPCASGMLEYYKKILFSPVQKMNAPDGVFWWCVNKIVEIMNVIKSEAANGEVEDARTNMEKNSSCASSVSPSILNAEQAEIAYPVQLQELFSILEYLICVMEADLNVGLIKNMSDLKKYTMKSGRPLIAVALWGCQGIAGPVNAKCKQLIKTFFIIFQSYQTTVYVPCFKRLISLMAGVVYACERNTKPPKYPNIGTHCKEFTDAFSSVMMSSGFNMVEVQTILKLLKPDWFQFCVSSNLVEKLYGRNMDMSLQPAISLLKNLCILNQEFPSQEEMSRTMLGETGSDSIVNINPEELSSSFVKYAVRKDAKGETRLHVACRRNHVSEVEKLLNVPNINVNEKDNMGWTPLHEAALHGSTECVKLLLNFRTPAGGPAVDSRIKNSNGVTPLMDAVIRNHVDVARQLLHYGGPELLLDKNDEGHSARDLASSQEMINILQNIPEKSIHSTFAAIPRTLYIKLAVLTQRTILFYIQFSEVWKIAYHLKNNIELKRNENSFVKLRPLTFKQDHSDLKTLQAVVKEMSNCNLKLMEQLRFLVDL